MKPTQQNVSEKTTGLSKHPAIKKTLNIITTVLVVLLFVLGLTMVVIAFSSANDPDNMPNLLGVSPVNLLTNSMAPEAPQGSLVFVKAAEKPEDLKVGDVVTFKWYVEGQETLLTHKIVAIDPLTDTFTTRGTNLMDDTDFVAAYPDWNEMTDEQKLAVTAAHEYPNFAVIRGKVVGVVPGVGYVLGFLKSFWGFGIIIVLPLAAFFIYRLVILIKVVNELRKEKNGNKEDELKKQIAELQAKLQEKEASGKG